MKAFYKLFFFACLLPFMMIGITVGVGFVGLLMGWKTSHEIIDWLSKK